MGARVVAVGREDAGRTRRRSGSLRGCCVLFTMNLLFFTRRIFGLRRGTVALRKHPRRPREVASGPRDDQRALQRPCRASGAPGSVNAQKVTQLPHVTLLSADEGGDEMTPTPTASTPVRDTFPMIAVKRMLPTHARILMMLALTKTQEVHEIQRIFDQY